VTSAAPGGRDLRAHPPGAPPTARDLRPLAVATITAALSLALAVAAARWAWLGPDVGRGDGFCEAARAGWIRQPANTWSNLGFVVAGLSVAWYAGVRARLGVTLGAHPGLATAYAVLVVLLGPGSMAMHATQTDLGGHLDLLSMYLIASFAAAYALMRLVRQGAVFFFQVFLLMVAACELVGTIDADVPVVHVAGNLAFGALLVTAIAVEVVLWRRADGTRTDLRWGAGAVGSMALAFTIWNLAQGPWCDPTSWLQGHAAWHLLCAVAAYLLFRLYCSERVTDALRPVAVGSRSLPAVDR
jgi:hypothetical protein